MTPPVIELRGVTKSFGTREVLRGIDLIVPEHHAVVLIGSSGSGKSTLLRCINLLEEIDDGDIFLDGEVITDPRVHADSARKRMGMVFQSFNLFPHRNVLHNITLAPTKAHRMPKSDAEAHARELLERFGLAGREHDYPDRLSGGQQQRVAIVRAIATRPRLLLLDEITSALDPELVGEVLDVVTELKHDGMTMVIRQRVPGGVRTATYHREPQAGPFTDADVALALSLTPGAGRHMEPGQHNRTRRAVTRFGTA